MLSVSPAVALTSAMACQVHRNMIIQSLRDSEGAGGKALTAPRFADRQTANETLPTSTVIWVPPESDGQTDSRGEG